MEEEEEQLKIEEDIKKEGQVKEGSRRRKHK